MYYVITRAHTHTFPLSLALSVCFSNPIYCLHSLIYIWRSEVQISSIWLKAFELLSIQLHFSLAFLFSSPRLFISLFLQQWAGLVSSCSPAISPRCALPSCCSALIKELLGEWLRCTESLVENNISLTEARSCMSMTANKPRQSQYMQHTGRHTHTKNILDATEAGYKTCFLQTDTWRCHFFACV